MSAGISPTPWAINSSGGAMTILSRDRSVLAVIVGGGDAAPFEEGNAALMAAGPELSVQLTDGVALLREAEWHSDGGSGLWCNYCRGGAGAGQPTPKHAPGCRLATFFTKTESALAKAEAGR